MVFTNYNVYLKVTGWEKYFQKNMSIFLHVYIIINCDRWLCLHTTGVIEL